MDYCGWIYNNQQEAECRLYFHVGGLFICLRVGSSFRVEFDIVNQAVANLIFFTLRIQYECH